jgi:serine/threonine protein kinase
MSRTQKYTNAADVYSFALVFFEVLTGEVPFANVSKSQILGKIRCGERPILPPDDYCPLHLSAFIKECWATRPEDHPKFPEICQRLWECKDTILIPLPMPPPKTLNREKGHTYTMCN